LFTTILHVERIRVLRRMSKPNTSENDVTIPERKNSLLHPLNAPAGPEESKTVAFRSSVSKTNGCIESFDSENDNEFDKLIDDFYPGLPVAEMKRQLTEAEARVEEEAEAEAQGGARVAVKS
jgi:hypothetical protein